VDINSAYLHCLADRFANPGFELAIRCADLNDARLEPEAFNLVHAALVCEYITWRPFIPHVAGTLTRGGMLSVVLQLPATAIPPGALRRYTSLHSLEALFHFVDPDALIEAAGEAGLIIDRRRLEPLLSGKAFEV